MSWLKSLAHRFFNEDWKVLYQQVLNSKMGLSKEEFLRALDFIRETEPSSKDELLKHLQKEIQKLHRRGGKRDLYWLEIYASMYKKIKAHSFEVPIVK